MKELLKSLRPAFRKEILKMEVIAFPLRGPQKPKSWVPVYPANKDIAVYPSKYYHEGHPDTFYSFSKAVQGKPQKVKYSDEDVTFIYIAGFTQSEIYAVNDYVQAVGKATGRDLQDEFYKANK